MRPIRTIILLLGTLMLVGCLPSQQEPVKSDLRAADTPSRVPAIVNAAETKDEPKLAEMVHALSDKDPAVRLFAIQSLHARTGQSFDYRYYDGEDKRQPAIDRWHDWLADQGLSEPVQSGYDAVDPTED